MQDIQSSEELAFVSEEIDQLVTPIVESVLKNEDYDGKKVAQWIDKICEQCMEELVELGKPFKYIVTAMIMQKNGAGVHSANSLFVDPSKDGIVSVKWPTDKKGDGSKTMYCIVNVLAVSF